MITPITVENIPAFLDFVQPESEIKVVKANKPSIKHIIPIILGNKKSLEVTFFRYPPGVVIIEILVIAKTLTRKQAADTVAVLNSLLLILSDLSETIRLATIAMENPLSKALIKMS